MIAIQITDTKTFMQQILAADSFDSFLLEEATITTFNSFQIDGRIQKEFYTAEEIETMPEKNLEFSRWQEIRPIAFSLIKGKKTPLNFQFVMHLNETYTKQILASEDCTVPQEAFKAFVLNIKYDGSHVSCITATAFHTFVMDKSADALWDKAVCAFLTKHNIAFETE